MKAVREAAVFLLTLPAVAPAAAPDLSGFWMPQRVPMVPEPQLLAKLPPGTVLLGDTGPVEFGVMEFGGLQLQPEALAAAKKWDPRQDMTVSNACKAPSIVYALQGPFPIEIHQATQMLVMRLEYFDLTRVIFLPPLQLDAPLPPTKTGYSLGHWEGDTLVVTTTHLKEATITNNGLEHSAQMQVFERFRLSRDGRTLMATQEYDDPLVLKNHGARFIAWRKVTGDHVHAYDCDPAFAENYLEKTP
jgi:hypothetical protein